MTSCAAGMRVVGFLFCLLLPLTAVAADFRHEGTGLVFPDRLFGFQKRDLVTSGPTTVVSYGRGAVSAFVVLRPLDGPANGADDAAVIGEFETIVQRGSAQADAPARRDKTTLPPFETANTVTFLVSEVRRGGFFTSSHATGFKGHFIMAQVAAPSERARFSAAEFLGFPLVVAEMIRGRNSEFLDPITRVVFPQRLGEYTLGPVYPAPSTFGIRYETADSWVTIVSQRVEPAVPEGVESEPVVQGLVEVINAMKMARDAIGREQARHVKMSDQARFGSSPLAFLQAQTTMKVTTGGPERNYVEDVFVRGVKGGVLRVRSTTLLDVSQVSMAEDTASGAPLVYPPPLKNFMDALSNQLMLK